MKITPQLLKQLSCTPDSKSPKATIDEIGDLPTQAALQRLGLVQWFPETSSWVRTLAGEAAIQRLCLFLYDWIADENDETSGQNGY